MKRLNKLTIKEATKGLQNGEFTSLDLTNACLEAIKARNEELNVFITVTEDLALKQAQESDDRRKKGENLGLLEGIPCAIKDNLNIKGIRTTAGSRILENFEAVDDAFVITKLKENGAVFLGKTNMDEFAMGSSTESSYFGVTKNPHNIDMVSGGSSGGSAAAVASDMCIFSIGSDTGGSIRQPAAFCGVYGLKPTYGAVSRNGLLSMSSSLDQIGPFTKTVDDAEIVLKVLAQEDKGDSTMDKKIVQEVQSFKKEETKSLRIGVLSQSYSESVQKEIREAIKQVEGGLKDKVSSITKIELPILDYALNVYYIIMPVEASSNLGRYDGIKYGFSSKEAKNLLEVYTKSRGEGFGKEVQRRIILGAYASSEGYKDQYYGKAQKVRAKITEELNNSFKDYDLLIVPTTPNTAFKIGEKAEPLRMYLEDIFTVSANISGIPAISVPFGEDKSGLPIGVQIMGPRGSEGKILALARELESNL